MLVDWVLELVGDFSDDKLENNERMSLGASESYVQRLRKRKSVVSYLSANNNINRGQTLTENVYERHYSFITLSNSNCKME